MLDKGISADGNPKANVAINHKARRREQRTEVIEGGIGSEHAHGGSVRVGRRDTLTRNLVFTRECVQKFIHVEEA